MNRAKLRHLAHLAAALRAELGPTDPATIEAARAYYREQRRARELQLSPATT